MNNISVRAVSKGCFAFSFMFGFYLMSHGHLSHGAGIAGGVIIALGILQALIVLGKGEASKIITADNARVSALAGVGVLLFIGILGYFYGTAFMSEFIGLGRPYTVFGAGLAVVINTALCFSAAGSIVLIYLSLFSGENKG